MKIYMIMKGVLLLIFLAAGIARSQTYTVKVFDIQTSEPVIGAPFTITQLQQVIQSDTSGRIHLTGVSYEGLFLVYRGSEYEPDSIKLSAGENVLSFPLRSGLESKLNEVVVSGTIKEISRMDSPVPIEIYNPAFFRKNVCPNLFSAMENVNGVRPQMNCNVCNTGDIHINGMEGAYTMVMIDGMPLVSALSTVYGLMGIPNSMVERVEIIKGPASTLYGSEAVGGLINVITKNPKKSPLVQLDLNSTTYQEWSMDLSLKVKLKRATGLISSNYFLYDTPKDINGDNFTDITLQNRFSLFNKWNFDRKENRKSSLGYRLVWEDRWGGEMQWTPAFRGGDSIYGENIITKRIEAFGVYQLPVKEHLNFNYSYTYHQQNSAYGNTLYLAKQQIGFAQLIWDKNRGRHDFLAGSALRYTYYDDNTPVTTSYSDTSVNSPSKVLLPGIFIQDQWSINEFHRLLAGIRYDYNSDHGSILSPRLNYQWIPNNKNTLRLSLGNGYRVVNLFSEDHSALNGAREVVIMSELKPEKSYNANMNYVYKRFRSKANWILDGSLFYTYFSNKIIADYITDPNKVIFDNLKGYAISRGLTLNSDLNFPFGLKVISGITLMDVYSMVPDLNNQLQKTPQLQASPFSGTWSVSYTISKISLTIDYTGNVYSPMHLPVLPNDFRPDRSPWFSIQNIQITKKFNKGIELYGGVKNLLNFIPKYPIMRPNDPFDKHITENNPYGYTFDPGYNYASVQSIRGFLGVRWTIQ